MRQRSESSWAYGSWLGGKTGRCVWPPQRFGGGKALFGSAALPSCCAAAAQAAQLPSPANGPAALLWHVHVQLAGSSTQAWATARCAACSAAPAPTSRWVQVWGRAGPAIKPSMAWVAVVGR